MARQPSGKKSAPAKDALDDVKVTDEVDVAPASSSAPDSPATAAEDPVDSDVVEDPDLVEDTEVESEASPESVDAAESVEDVDASESVEDVDASESVDGDESEERSTEAAELWSDVRIEPVEIALPKGVGFTLRAYRMSNELATVEVVEEEDEAFAVLNRSPVTEDEEEFDLEEAFLEDAPGLHEEVPPPARARRGKAKDDDSEVDAVDAVEDEDAEDAAAHLDDDDSGEEDSGDDESDEELAGEDDLTDADAEADDDDEDDEDDPEPEPEEVPLFLTSGGKLLLFRSPEGLVEFVKSAEEHDFAQLDTWEDLRSRITAAAVVPSEEDSYELDLVVENLRGGHDAWDTDLLIGAGEAARDLAYALRLEAIRTALAPGSPLDDLDEGLRASASGGMGGFFARRKLKKIGAQQAALGWRTIIGKISAVVDWRD